MLLCSDGLWHAFPDCADLAAHSARADGPEALWRDLVAEAKRRDGSDNISAVAVFLGKAGVR
jgi:serine/threonine protein phosphatase PrpC